MRAALVIMCLLLAGTAFATNGMNMIGYGIRSAGMGGADAAVLTDASGVSGNPAVMGKTSDRSISAGVSLLMPKLNVSNENLGLDLEGEAQMFPLPSLAYSVRPGSSSKWILGIEAYAQGGMGVEFLNFPTGATSSDRISSNVMFMRLTGAASYQFNEALTVGLAAIGGYARMEFSMFPETSPGGIDVTDLTGTGFAGRVGLQYKVCNALSMGAVYTSEASLDLSDGNAAIQTGGENPSDYSAEMLDFAWPQEAEFGIALNPTPDFLIALDGKWINWSSSMDVVSLVVGDGTFPPFPDGQGGYTDTMPFMMKWDDQMVYALGIEYAVNDKNTVRAGFNYGSNPVPDSYLSPLFPAIVETHATIGYGVDLGQWDLGLAYEHGFEKSQTNSNENLMVNPFGPGIAVDHSQNTIHFQTSYSF